MARIPIEVIAEVRERADIVAIIGETVELKKAGASHRGLCPFHKERSPSFYVTGDKHFFNCFGCGKNGDVFTFLQEMQGLQFLEAVREAARRCGITIPEREESPRERAVRDERSRLFDVNAIATAWFQEALGSSSGAAARTYLASRGIGEEVASTFKLGVAPDGWDGLSRYLLESRRIPAQLAMTLGLIAPREGRSGYYDKFRNRVMCPVILPAGEIVAFSGRTLGTDKETPKYVNSPASPVYTKGNVLFGLHAARAAFRAKKRAVLVEGNFDVIALHQAGFAETVGPLGTALTPKQIDTIRLLAPQVILCLDGDKAGRSAALKDIAPLVEAGVEARVAALPEGDDPDTFVRKHGPAAFEELLGRAQPAVEYFIHEVWGASDRSSSDRRAAALREAAALLVRVGNETKREMLVGQLAAALDVQPDLIRRAMNSPGPAQNGSRNGQGTHSEAPQKAPERTPSGPPPPPSELKIIAILADHPGLLPEAEQLGVRSLLTDERLRDMYSAAQAGRPLHEAIPREISGVVLREVLAGSYKSLAEPSRTLADALRSLSRDRLLAEFEALGKQLKDAQRRGDQTLARELALRQVETRTKADRMMRRPEEDPR